MELEELLALMAAPIYVMLVEADGRRASGQSAIPLSSLRATAVDQAKALWHTTQARAFK